MTGARLLSDPEAALGPKHQHNALELARRLPGLMIMAKDIAASVLHGVHGRRRAGTGETFWQFRPFVTGESMAGVDWRRSARDDRLYIREREWEAAQTIWVWMDRSPSMAFISASALAAKIDRAIVLGLASADLLVRGGERVGIPGLTRPLASRNIVERLADAIINEAGTTQASELPPREPLAPRSQVLLISDFLNPSASIAETLAVIAARGARGHLIMIADPVEETFPFEGHMEFIDVDSAARFRAGRAEDYRADYALRLAAHREAVRQAASRQGWSFALHRTDKPASQALLHLAMQLGGGTPLQTSATG
jgi:uncharacterized protein (DUF58 family)